MEVPIIKSVTQRIKEIKQPRGGYVNPKLFVEITLDASKPLNEQENIHASLVGLAVDYLTRYTVVFQSIKIKTLISAYITTANVLFNGKKINT